MAAPSIDIRWLLDLQECVLPDPSVHDYSALQAAVGRHRVNTPRLGEQSDSAWCAAALLHTIVLLKPFPARNRAYAASAAVAYMHHAGESVDPPYGAMVDLSREVHDGLVDVYGVAERLRGWRL